VTRRQNGAIDERTSRHPGYAISLSKLSKRWLVEKPFGWLKQIGPLKKVKLRGLSKVDWLFVFSCAAFNLIRIPKLRAQRVKQLAQGSAATYQCRAAADKTTTSLLCTRS